MTWLIEGGYAIDPSQGLARRLDLVVEGDKVFWGQPPSQPYEYVLRASGLTVCPGFIDLHCHLREPGEEEKETIASGTRAAARGGFTTLCAMPNTHPPIDSRGALEFLQNKAAQEGLVRVWPIACLSQSRAGKELVEMTELARAGAVAFSDDGSPVADPLLMRRALEYSLGLNLPIIDHPEDLQLSAGGVMNEGWVSTRMGLRGMPAAAEEVAVARDIALSELTGARLHLAHISTRGSVELVRRAKERGLPITAEVTPHHLTLTEEKVLGYNTQAKVNPPLRTKEDGQALLQGLKEGVIDAIATDHAPHTEVDKFVEFDRAAFGISGLETALGSLLKLVHQGELELTTLIARLTQGPARVLGKDGGSLRPGSLADIVIFDPDAEWVVEPRNFASKGRNTPMAGETLKGKVMATIVGGKLVYRDPELKLEKG